MKKIVFHLMLCGLIMPHFCLGADFRNLGFDEADTSGVGNPLAERRRGPGNPAEVLPGWILSLGGERYGVVNVNPDPFPFEDDIALGDGKEGFGPTEGKFALRLFRRDPGSPVWTLEQTGTIPAGTKFLTYRCWNFGMQVQIDGEVAPPLDWQLPSQPGISNLVYDVSKFAGQEVKLAFVGPFGPYGWPSFQALAYFDSITFLAEAPRITAVVQTTPGSNTNEVAIRFTPVAGRRNFVQFRDDLSRDGVWQPLPGGPHNPGTVTDKSPAAQRIYRLEVLVPLE